jgi:hypothetical protein
VIDWIRRKQSNLKTRQSTEEPWTKGSGGIVKTSIVFLEVIQEMKDSRYEPVDCRKLLGCLGERLLRRTATLAQPTTAEDIPYLSLRNRVQ